MTLFGGHLLILNFPSTQKIFLRCGCGKTGASGGTRDKKGGEELVYFRGGFGALSKALVQNIEELGSSVKFNFEVEDLITHKKHIKSVKTKKSHFWQSVLIHSCFSYYCEDISVSCLRQLGEEMEQKLNILEICV